MLYKTQKKGRKRGLLLNGKMSRNKENREILDTAHGGIRVLEEELEVMYVINTRFTKFKIDRFLLTEVSAKMPRSDLVF